MLDQHASDYERTTQTVSKKSKEHGPPERSDAKGGVMGMLSSGLSSFQSAMTESAGSFYGERPVDFRHHWSEPPYDTSGLLKDVAARGSNPGFGHITLSADNMLIDFYVVNLEDNEYFRIRRISCTKSFRNALAQNCIVSTDIERFDSSQEPCPQCSKQRGRVPKGW